MTLSAALPAVPWRSLALETAAANPIANHQSREISAFERAQFAPLETAYGARVLKRGLPTATYNCHGLVFASRRTCITNTTTIKAILTDDGYQEVPRDEALPGDLLLYFSDDGDPEHSALVLTAPQAEPLHIPFVCSKWGRYSELIHPANACPYNFSAVRYYRVVR